MKSAEVSKVDLADILRNRWQGLSGWLDSIEQILHSAEVFCLRNTRTCFNLALLCLWELQSRKEVLHGIEVINFRLNCWLLLDCWRLTIDSCEQLLHGREFLKIDLGNDWDFTDFISRSCSFSCLWDVFSTSIDGLEEILEGGKLLT